MNDVLQECTHNFGPAPRRFSLRDRWTYLRIPRPAWLAFRQRDGLIIHFKNLPALYRDGRVVWGRIVQANELLFTPGIFNCPADVVYSFADIRDTKPEVLPKLAGALFSLKGTKPKDPHSAAIADHLTDECTRTFGLPIPPTICPSMPCVLTTTYIARQHLPSGFLASLMIPLIVRDTRPFLATVLPSRYWPENFTNQWRQGFW